MTKADTPAVAIDRLPCWDPTNPAHRLAYDLKRGRIPGYAAADVQAVLTAYESQAERLREVEGDAARYRFLRERDPAGYREPVPPGLFIGRVPENVILTGADADAAIDAALIQSPTENGE